MPPSMIRCAYFPENLLAYALHISVWPPLASPSRVMVGTVMIGAFGKPAFQLVAFRVALSEAEAPTVIVDHNADMIGIVEGLCTAIERRIIKTPFRRCSASK